MTTFKSSTTDKRYFRCIAESSKLHGSNPRIIHGLVTDGLVAWIHQSMRFLTTDCWNTQNVDTLIQATDGSSKKSLDTNGSQMFLQEFNAN